MLKKWLIAFFLLSCVSDALADQGYAFLINFKDKNGAPALSEASSFLSERALERRTRYGITLDEKDVPVSPIYLQQIASLTDGEIRGASKWLNSCILVLNDSAQIIKLSNLSFISSMQCVGYTGRHDSFENKKNQQKEAAFKTTGNPTFYGSAWPQTNLVKGDCLHDKGWQGQGMLIAVLDEGFHYVDTEPAFDSVYNSGRIIDTWNFVQSSSDVYSGFLSHGTDVLSTLAANVPNTYVGAAPQAQYALYATEESGHDWPIELTNMVMAFERADSIGADVITSSTGYNTFHPPFDNQSITPAQMDGKTTVAAIGVNIAAQKGMLVVITAGNEGSGGLLTPGDADSALTVGNVDAMKTPSGSSGWGPNAANHIKPEVCALGNPGYIMRTGLAPFQGFGTSISTPQIAGFAACLWQGSAGKTNSEIKQAIIKSSHLYPTPQMPQLGYGVPDFCVADIVLDIPDMPSALPQTTIYPNPCRDRLYINIASDKNEMIDIIITDITGKTAAQKKEKLDVGENFLDIEIPSLPSGFYVCQIISDGKLQTFKFAKQ